MARSAAGGGEGSVAEATTLIFPKKKTWEEAAEAKRTAKKRSGSANGAFSKVLARLVEEDHMDRRAARMVLALDAIEDDSDLHVTVHHLIDGIKKLGILERAMAQEELFSENKVDTATIAAAGAKSTKKQRAAEAAAKDGGGGATVTQIGDAARKVAERAGEQLPGSA